MSKSYKVTKVDKRKKTITVTSSKPGELKKEDGSETNPQYGYTLEQYNDMLILAYCLRLSPNITKHKG